MLLMAAEPIDFMALEPLLLDRLRAALPAHVHVLAARDLAGLTEGTQLTPAVHVLYRDYRPGRAPASGWEELDQLWLTVIAVRNVSTLSTNEAVRADAGPLMGAVIGALGGWRPDLRGYKPLSLDGAPAAGYRAGFGYFPLGWRAPMRVRAACTGEP
ncbi:MAG: hypothetical protein QMB75_09065 [Thauera sp.]